MVIAIEDLQVDEKEMIVVQDHKPDDWTHDEIIHSLTQALNNHYVFPDIAKEMGNYLELKLSRKDYEAIKSPEAFGEQIALIFDLRNNGGGNPFMVAFITSYLFDSEPFHLNSFYSRAKDDLSQSWTLPYVPGKRYGNKPVYVLTSNRTFSAAEEFAYNLKNLKRATIVGEVTAGGAHPGFSHQLNKHFSIFIPDGRAINPITQTNWEGTGVIPDVKTTQNEAYETAYELALLDVINNYQERKEYGFLVKEAENHLKQLRQRKQNN